MSCLRLVLIDEVHIWRELRWGADMEVLVARTQAFSGDVRIVDVSATISNAVDLHSVLESGTIKYASLHHPMVGRSRPTLLSLTRFAKPSDHVPRQM